MTTIDEVWERHRARLEQLARDEFGGDEGAVAAVCYHALVRAGRDIDRGDEPSMPSAEGAWVAAVVREVSRELRSGTLETAVPAGPLPDALPAQLRARLQALAARESELHALEADAKRSPVARAILRLRRRLATASSGSARR